MSVNPLRVVCECCGASPHVGRCHPADVRFLAGDIVFFQSDGFIAWAIRQVTRWHLWQRLALLLRLRIREALGELEGRSYVNHVAMVVEPGTWRTAVIVDAQPPFISLEWLRKYKGDFIAVYRPNGVTDEQRAAARARALGYRAKPYGVGKILLHALGVQGLSFIDWMPMCAWTVGVPWSEAGVRTSKEAPRAAAPDSQWDWVRANPGASDEPGTFTCLRDLTILEG